jgi:hypothetical protein
MSNTSSWSSATVNSLFAITRSFQRSLGPGYVRDRVAFSLAIGTPARNQRAVVDAYVFDRSGGREVIGEVTLAEQLARQSMGSLAVVRANFVIRSLRCFCSRSLSSFATFH